MELNPLSMISLAGFFINIFLAAYLFGRKPRTRPKMIFISTLFFLALASFGDFLVRNPWMITDVALLYKIIHALLALSAFQLLHLAFAFLNRKFFFSYHLLPAIIAGTILFTDLFLESNTLYTAYGPEEMFGRLAFILLLYYVSVLLYALYLLTVVRSNIRSKLIREKLLVLMFGAAAVIVPSLICSFTPLFNFSAYPIFPFSAAIGGAIMAYAFLRGREL